MRLYLLPLTTSRTLLYSQRLNVATNSQQGLADKVGKKAAKLWAGWEARESGWQKKVVSYGNSALRRIPYEEWGLKSVPPISARRKDDELKGNEKIELVFPDKVIPTGKAEQVVRTLATERDALHKRKLIWCLIGMPISAPFALVPVIPNLPFFYLVYRAWSHWRALEGGKHLRFLVDNKLLALSPSKLLNDIYAPLIPEDTNPTPSKLALGQGEPLRGNAENAKDEAILLSQANGQRIAQALDVPELAVEIERAIWQVNHAKQAKQEGATDDAADEAAKQAAKQVNAEPPKDKGNPAAPPDNEKR
ncbi:mitochondrial K+-H+ exchange-related-domain-containing protein [Colletotrichum cereale]|nr:mitochondrial K+-H+ exchange-related-domain-containing protein [Colletotrichum cereale]